MGTETTATPPGTSSHTRTLDTMTPENIKYAEPVSKGASEHEEDEVMDMVLAKDKGKCTGLISKQDVAAAAAFRKKNLKELNSKPSPTCAPPAAAAAESDSEDDDEHSVFLKKAHQSGSRDIVIAVLLGTEQIVCNVDQPSPRRALCSTRRCATSLNNSTHWTSLQGRQYSSRHWQCLCQWLCRITIAGPSTKGRASRLPVHLHVTHTGLCYSSAALTSTLACVRSMPTAVAVGPSVFPGGARPAFTGKTHHPIPASMDVCLDVEGFEQACVMMVAWEEGERGATASSVEIEFVLDLVVL
ncbi:hypothetical protein NUW54_g10676 [Trametes sanguinea]|uniref:Uncharacterized protein n=1 Tax=Trametes sanguinea TaxID=158606 RepID=A0ACC1NWR3_9APHY|nr:hypothetical protein NUW54_g10676 [Trametes sanguinea]